MKKKRNIVIVAICILLICLIVAYLCTTKFTKQVSQQDQTTQNEQLPQGYIQEIESGIKLNTSTKLNQTKQWEGLEFSNIQLTTRSGITTLITNVTNTNPTATPLKNVQFILLDQTQTELATLNRTHTTITTPRNHHHQYGHNRKLHTSL